MPLHRRASVKLRIDTETSDIQSRSQGGVGGYTPPLDSTGSNGSELGKECGKPPTDGEITALEAFSEVFWPVYPRKIAKAEALKAWKSLKLKDSDQTTLDAIMVGLDGYIRTEWRLDEPQYIPYPATWLRGRRWEDFA